MSYFNLNPNILVWINGNSALFYDANKNRQFAFHLDKVSLTIISTLKNIRNLNTISLSDKQFNAPIISKLIQNDLGRITASPLSSDEIELPPIYSFTNRMDTDTIRTSTRILAYVKTVTIYLSGACNNTCAHCDVLFKQGHFCHKPSSYWTKASREIALGKIKGLTNLSKINLIFSSVKESTLIFVRELASSRVILACHIHWKNISSGIIDKLVSGNGVVIVKVLIDLSDISREQLENVIDLQHRYKNNLVLVFCVTSEKDFILLQDNYHRTIKENVEVRYVYTGREKDHIIKHYLLEDSDLQQITTDNNRIFGNRELNFSLFGELVIFPDGTIRLNQNTEVIGTISDDWVEMLNNALNKPNPWLMTRNKTKPCSNCIYRDLCPPIRNLELFMGDKLACVDFYKKLPSPNE